MDIGQSWEIGCASPILSTRYVFALNVIDIHANFIFYYPQSSPVTNVFGASSRVHPTALENKRICSFSMADVCFPTPLPHHHRKRASALVFDGSCLFFNTTTPPPLKMSIHTRFRWWLFVFQTHYPTTLENERVCSFSTVVVYFLYLI